MVLCTLADSGLPAFPGEGLMAVAAYLDGKSRQHATDSDFLHKPNDLPMHPATIPWFISPPAYD